jgi:predicted ATPase
VGRLSGELDKKHRLVGAQGIARIDGQRLSRYRFRHILFQKYLYSSLDEVQRAHLHEAVGSTLEAMYQNHTDAMPPIAGQLAWHFREAGIAKKAIHYLRQAGERAVRLSAFQEALAHLTDGLALLMTLPDSPERVEQELALQLSLGMAWTFGSTIVEGGKAYTRARALCQQIGKTSELPRIVGMLTTCHYVGGQHRKARALAEKASDLAQEVGEPMLVAAGHWRLGFVSFALGEFTTARAHLEPMIAFYEPRHHRALVSLCGSDPGPSALAYDACCLWCLGYPDQALKRSQEALALARELEHSLSLVEVLHFSGCILAEMCHDAQALKEHSEELLRWADEKGLHGWLPPGTCFRGEALIMMGQVGEGMAQLCEGMEAYHSKGERINLPRFLYSQAEAQAEMDQPEKGLSTLSEALALVEQTNERNWEAEIYRLQAELLLQVEDEGKAADSLNKAVEVARRQQAKSWELKATTDLARLWQRQGKTGSARRALAEVYDWFTEGFDTADLKEARTLLDSLS